MIIDKAIEKKVTLTYLGFSFLAAQLCFWLLPNVFETWNEQTVDRLLAFKTRSATFRPAYDDTLVHLDLNNSSKQVLNNFHLNRADHARAIRNLSQMDVALQLHDFIYAGTTDAQVDRHLVNAVREAGNVYIGMAYEIKPRSYPHPGEQPDEAIVKFLRRKDWPITDNRYAAKYHQGLFPIVPFWPLAEACRGMGYLNLVPDRDGVFRRLPLLFRTGDRFAVSFSLRAVCDYLQVPPGQIVIRPGAIVLRNARFPGRTGYIDIAIPVDRHGNMRINFIGAWDRMKHYRWSDVYLASDDEDDMDQWTDELSGKIVMVSDTSTGSSDVGQVSTDAAFPLSGVHANGIHTILTQSFLREFAGFQFVPVELALLLVLMFLSFHPSAVIFSVSAFGLGGFYLMTAGVLAIYADILIPVIRPLLMILFGLVSLQIASAVFNARTHAQSEKAREVAEKELEIGRQIQSGFFPKNLPTPAGWEFVAHFKPARQVAGDFYDIFELQAGRLIGVVIADVCDKGVGAALFMALIRSLIRSSAEREIDNQTINEGAEDRCTEASLIHTIQQASDYIAIKHDDANMFATVFFGVLDPASGKFKYINCGHEPPVMQAPNSAACRFLKPTGPALGMMPDMNFRVAEVQFQRGDIFFAFTDGVTDALNADEEFFSRERLLELLQHNLDSADTLMDTVKSALSYHIANTSQFDDITMIAIRFGQHRS